MTSNRNRCTILQISIGFCLLISMVMSNETSNPLQDYLHSRQRRELALEFFDYYEHFTENDLDTRIDTTDLKCVAELRALSKGINSGSLWAWKIIDSWGSVPAGIMYGTRYDFGNFDECLAINQQISKLYQIRGQYCFAQLPIGLLLPIDQGLAKHVNLKIGICMPSDCRVQVVDKLMKRFLNATLNLHFPTDVSIVRQSSCKTNVKEPYGAAAICTIVLLSILGSLVLGSTLYDYLFCCTHQDKALMHPLLRAFSAYANGRQLFRIVNQSKNPNVIPALHGMRCMSLIWVIFGHTYLISFLSPKANGISLINWASSPFAMFIQHAQFSVDTFFFLSGLLLVLIVLREMDKRSGKLNVPLMYLHRYLRLTPVLGIAILIYASLLPHLGDGPLWRNIFFDNYSNCKTYWWATLLYVQNYAAQFHMCINHSWYLAVDMQLYILSPIFLYALWHWKHKALIGIIILTLMLSVYMFTLIMTSDYSLFYFKNTRSNTSEYHLYYDTHNHAVPWLIGLVFGYYLHSTKGQSFKLSKYIISLAWLATLVMMFTSIFALYGKSQPKASELTKVEDAFYLTFTRCGWPLALCWVVFSSIHGYGGLANSFLASPLWQPLSKISYSAYIFHVLLENINAGRTRTNTYFSNYDVILRFWSDFGMTIIISVTSYLLIEAPMAGAEIYMLRERSKAISKIPQAEGEQKTQKVVQVEIEVADQVKRSSNISSSIVDTVKDSNQPT